MVLSLKENVAKLNYERKNKWLDSLFGVSTALIYRWWNEYSQYGKESFSGNGITKMIPKEKELSDMKKRRAGKNGADCYSKIGHAVTVLTWQS